MASKRNSIFISYRRSGGVEMATLIRSALRERGFDVFMDFEDLRTGPFNTALFKAIDESAHVLVILTPGSLDRCVNEGDWVRLEVSHALKRGKSVVPILATGFTFPASLPTDMAPLRDLHGLSPSHEFFDASMDKLCSLLRGRPFKRRPRWWVSLALVAVLAALVATALHLAFTQRAPEVASVAAVGQPPATNPWTGLQYAMLEPCDAADESTLAGNIVATCNDSTWRARCKDGQLVLANAKEEGNVRYYSFDLGERQAENMPMSLEVCAFKNEHSRGVVGAGIQYRYSPIERSYYAYFVSIEGELVFLRKTPATSEALFVSNRNHVDPSKMCTLGIIPTSRGFELYRDDVLVKVITDIEQPLRGSRFGILAIGPGEFCFDNIAVYCPNSRDQRRPK